MSLEISQALDVLSNAMKNDSDYAWSWHCNVAMNVYDEGVDHVTANKAAARLMQGMFGVDTSINRYYQDIIKNENK